MMLPMRQHKTLKSFSTNCFASWAMAKRGINWMNLKAVEFGPELLQQTTTTRYSSICSSLPATTCVSLSGVGFHDPLLYQLCNLDIVFLHEHHMRVSMYPNLPQIDLLYAHTCLFQVINRATIIHCMVASLRGYDQNRYLHQANEFARRRCLLEASEQRRVACNHCLQVICR